MADNITYKINVDSAQAQQAVAGLTGSLKELAAQAGKLPGADPLGGVAAGASRARFSLASMTGTVHGLGGAFLSLKGLAAGAAMAFAKSSVDAATTAEGAFKGLESVANRVGVGIEAAWSSVRELTEDGVLSQTDAANALKNLFLFGIQDAGKAVEIINRVKDAAAFGRQSSLSWAEAIVSATEGIKNENSVLVDNAGITKNVAKIYQEYADSIGVSYNSLTQGQKAQAIYNGILRETQTQVGDTTKALKGNAGASASLSKAYEELKVSIGDGLTPAFSLAETTGASFLTNVLIPMTDAAGGLVKSFTAVLGLLPDVVKAFREADTFEQFDAKIRERTREQAKSIAFSIRKAFGYENASGPTSTTAKVQNSTDPKDLEAARRMAEERAKAEAQAKAKQDLDANEKSLQRAKQSQSDELAIFKSGLEAQKAALDEMLARNAIGRAEHARRSAALEASEAQKSEAMRVQRVGQLAKQLELAKASGDSEKLAAAQSAYDSEVRLGEAAANKLKTIELRAKAAVYQADRQSAAEQQRIDDTLRKARVDAERTVSESIIERDLASTKQLFEDKLISEADYITRSGALRDKQLADQIRRLEAERKYAATRSAATPEEAAQRTATVTDLDAQLKAAKNKRAAVAEETQGELRKSALETFRLQRDLDIELAEAEGRTFDAKKARIDAWLEEKRREFAALPEQLAKAERIAAAQLKGVGFEQAQDRASNINADADREIQAMQRRQQLGLVTDTEAEDRLNEIQARRVALLREQLEALKATSDNSDEARQAIAALGAEIEVASVQINSAAVAINESFFGALKQGFKDLVSGAKSFGEVFRNVLTSVLSKLSELALNSALTKLAASFGGSSGGLGGMLAGLFGGFRATGGASFGDKGYWVGEKGPELHFAGAPGTYVPTDRIVRVLEGMMRGRQAAMPRMPDTSSLQAVSSGVGATIENNIATKAYLATEDVVRELERSSGFQRVVLKTFNDNRRALGLSG